MKTSDYKSFSYLENGEVLFSEYDTIKSTKKLEQGSYRVNYEEYPDHIVTLKVDSDFETPKTHSFSGKKKLDTLFSSFFDKKILETVESMGFCHKVGVLLYGTEGTGKSTIIKHYCSKAIKDNKAIVFHLIYKGSYISKCWEFIQSIRGIQSNPIIVVFDEFDQQMNENEGFLKTAIDGNMSISNCIFFAATNYIDEIPKAMKNRPSRFKYSLKIKGVESEEDIKAIISNVLKGSVKNVDIDSMVKKLKGKTLDQIKHRCLDELMNIDNYEPEEKTIGFKKQ